MPTGAVMAPSSCDRLWKRTPGMVRGTGGGGKPARAQSAMGAVQQRLVRTDDSLIQLFDPPFDKGVLQPGYIKGYVPGIRENGGQYTHAATWGAPGTGLQA